MEALASTDKPCPPAGGAALLAAWLEGTDEAVAILAASDPRLPVLAASRAWCALAGQSHAAVVGAPCAVLLKMQSDLEPDFRERLRGGVVLERRLLDRNRRGQPFWSTLSIRVVEQEFLVVRRRLPPELEASRDDSRNELEHYEKATRCGSEGLWDWDLVSGDVWCNPSLQALLGYSADEQLEETFESLYGHVEPEHRSHFLRAVRCHLEQRHAFEVECQMRTRSGELRWFALRGAATRDQGGRPLRLSGSLHDVTERRQAEDLTRHAEDLQRRALDALHIAVGVLDGRGEIVELNRSWREFPSDRGLVGMRFGFGENYAGLCENAAERCPEGPAAARGIRAVLEGESARFTLAYRVDTPDGERHYELRAHPFVDGDSRGAFVIHMDVSATREAYAQLAASRDFYELLLDSIPIQISYVTQDRRVQYLNRSYERWFRLPLSAVRGRRIDDLMLPQRLEEMEPRLEGVLAGRDVEFEVRSTRADGEERDLAVSYVPHLDAAGSVAGFVSVARDVTEQKRLEASLRQAQKMEAVGQLTGGIAHDFNNLLSVIIGNLQLLERPLASQERLVKQVQTALRAALRGGDLTRRLLAFARQTVLEPRVVNVNGLLQGMNELLRRALGREIEIRTRLADDAWPVRVDPAQLENCILNLAINARDAMPRGGALSIETCNVAVDGEIVRRHPLLRAGDYLAVTVKDTGSGMTPDVVKHAFEPFFTTKEAGKGTGLGLSMVYGFLEQSGGLATIYSEVAVGTSIRLYFPRVDAPVPAMREPENPGTALPGGDETVLVVEDDADVRATVVVALRSLGYEVLEAGSAPEALEVVRANSGIDLLFTDVTLPGGMSGPDLARRAREVVPRLRVLFTSGFSESAVTHRGILDGTLPLISKPYAIADLARRVRAVLKQG